jgi:uncharacterized iron-regulated membrane protein
MTAARKWFFYVHLILGSVAGVLILIMAATGVLLAYERQIGPWVDRDVRSLAVQPGQSALSGGQLAAKICAVQPLTPSVLVRHSQAD